MHLARVVDVHDGDTAHLDIELAPGIVATAYDLTGKEVLSTRIYGINAPELKMPDRKTDNPAGIAARDYAMTLLLPGMLLGLTRHGWDKYGGRVDASITLPDGRDFAAIMLASGHAVVMKG
jgi:endonuclease YncB( thermonuclease family)